MRKRKYAHSSHDQFQSDTLQEDIQYIWKREFPEKFARLTGKKIEEDENDNIPRAEIHNLVGTALLKSDMLPLDLHLVAELVRPQPPLHDRARLPSAKTS